MRRPSPLDAWPLKLALAAAMLVALRAEAETVLPAAPEQLQVEEMEAGSSASAQRGESADAGVLMRWRYEPIDDGGGGGLGRLVLSFSDQASAVPVRYAPGQVAAWMQRRRGSLAERELACRDRIKTFVGVGIGRRADVDLNTYRILTINDDRTVSFINPFVGLNNAKLESIITLPGEPTAWLHLPQRAQLWVRLVAPDRVVRIDTATRRIVATVAMPEGGTTDASELAYDEPSARLWVALPQRGRVATLDVRQAEPAWRTYEAEGVRTLRVLDAGAGQSLVLSLHRGGMVHRWASAGPRVDAEWRVPADELLDASFSALARRALVHDGRRLWLLADDGEARALAVGHPIMQATTIDEGRHAFVVGGGRMSFVDLATGKLTAASAALPSPGALQFTSGYLYAIADDGASANLWSLPDLRAGRALPVNVILGSAAASTAKARSRSFEIAVPSPSGTGLLVANAADRLVFQYAEGMMAPVGSYSNYRRVPLGVTVLDLAPREVAPGRYEAVVRHDAGGRYDLAVSGVGPKLAVCDELLLAAPSKGSSPTETPMIEAKLIEVQALPGSRWRISAALFRRGNDEHAKATAIKGADDIVLMLFDRRSGWQMRTAMNEHRFGSGRYEAEVNVPRSAAYDGFVGSLGQELTLLQGRLGVVDLRGTP